VVRSNRFDRFYFAISRKKIIVGMSYMYYLLISLVESVYIFNGSIFVRGFRLGND